MFSSLNLARSALLVVALLSIVVYIFARKRGNDKLAAFVFCLFAGYALIQIAFVVFLWINHYNFPLNLEAMEGTVLQHVKRVLAGLPIYVEPQPEFVPLAYNPLYYFVSALFCQIFGVDLATLRLVAILGMFGAGAVIFLAVRKETESNWWGLMAVGLFAAAYRVMDTYLDNAHSDSWLLCTILLGCYLLSQNRSMFRNLWGVFILAISFWFKQHGALFAIGGVLYLTWQYGWRKALPFWILAGVVGFGLYIFSPTWLLGSQFHYYTWQVPRGWSEINLETVKRFAGFIIKSYPVLALVGVCVSAFEIVKTRAKSNIWYWMLIFAGLSGFIGSLDPGSNNNVFIPMGTWFIITGVLGLKQLMDRLPHMSRWGVSLVAIAISFVIFFYDPTSVIVSPQANVAYQDLVSYLKSLNGSVYAPWLGPLPSGYQLSPSVHWVPMEDIIRGPGVDERNHPTTRRLLASVINPPGKAYILMNYPLETDPLLGFLNETYTLDIDLGERFVALSTLPKRFNLLWPRYLYRYTPKVPGS